MTEHNIVIGSRGSRLAVIQSEMVRDFIREKKTGCQVEILTMKTTGDKILDRTLEKIGGKGLFVKELDKALRDGCSDLSVHSLKDMPMELSEELPLLAFSKRTVSGCNLSSGERKYPDQAAETSVRSIRSTDPGSSRFKAAWPRKPHLSLF